MTDLRLGKRYDLMRDRNRELNRIAVSLREYPIKCPRCKAVIGYCGTANIFKTCGECKA